MDIMELYSDEELEPNSDEETSHGDTKVPGTLLLSVFCSWSVVRHCYISHAVIMKTVKCL